ncbi:MAG: indole-3-glycerol phosphate synthase TrpC [Syntrophomonadaceae bacterium]|jgi:indole-3-glycerol phosphate synthase|nr:indole-3-glycerol phosphate synthase TrpC [Syntrophomonadaceae bacterium]
MILDEIANSTKRRLQEEQKTMPLNIIRQLAESLPVNNDFIFERQIALPGLSFICEIKRASPSKGIIAENFPYLQIAAEYEKAGADAISVLTEPEYFLGSNDYLRDIAEITNIPILRKDFIIDAYQIYQAKIINASAVLLICSLLDLLNQPVLQEFIVLTHSLGMSALVETRDEKEISCALEAGARVVGVNNRDLKTFQVDTNTSIRLRKMAPEDVLFVAESGIKSNADITLMNAHKVDAVLIGEALMRAGDKKQYLSWLKGENDGKD